MNICFLHNNGIIPDSGGISRITSTLVELFREHDINVYLLGVRNLRREYKYDKFQKFLPNEEQLMSNVNINYLKDYIQKKQISILINQAALSERVTDYLSALTRECNVKIISCIHNSLLTPIENYAYQREYILKKNGLSVVYNFFKTTLAKSLFKFIYIRKHRKAFRKLADVSDKIVSLVPQLNSELEEIIGYKLKEKSAIIPNCLKIPESVIIEKEKIIAWVGTTDFCVKRLDFMLRIWKNIQDDLSDWHLCIVGDGPNLLDAKEMASDLNLKRLEFLGRTNPENIYEKASLLLVTSSHESFSLVTVEGMSRGVVPIVNNSFPAANYITDGGQAGILLPPFDFQKMASTIIELCRNKEKRDIFQEHGLSYSKQFDLDHIFYLWKSLFDKLS